MRILASLIVICFCANACVEVINKYEKVPPGIWRATLQVDGEGQERFIDTDNETERVFTELTEGELPFNFEVVYTESGEMEVYLLNAEERILADDVDFGRNPATLEDSIRIDFTLFDSYILGRYEENRIEGFWVVNYKDQYKIPFRAQFGRDHRFTNLKKKPVADLSGKWEATFEIGTEDEYKGIGEFVQEGNELRGTFRTETGDYRYLEGTVQDNKAYLSCFDGAHAFLFQAKILENGEMIGSFRNGKHYLTTWKAARNDDFELGNPDELTFVKGQEQFFFEFPDLEGDMVSLNDSKYDGKPLLVSIFGTWCPNCRDEMKFLKNYKAENPQVEFNVVALAFEKYREAEKSMAAIQRYKDKMELPFDFLYGGYFEKDEACEVLPMLNKVISYPTLIFIDKEKDVRRIHTGFSGPATSKYGEFVSSFDELIKTLADE